MAATNSALTAGMHHSSRCRLQLVFLSIWRTVSLDGAAQLHIGPSGVLCHRDHMGPPRSLGLLQSLHKRCPPEWPPPGRPQSPHPPFVCLHRRLVTMRTEALPPRNRDRSRTRSSSGILRPSQSMSSLQLFYHPDSQILKLPPVSSWTDRSHGVVAPRQQTVFVLVS